MFALLEFEIITIFGYNFKQSNSFDTQKKLCFMIINSMADNWW